MNEGFGKYFTENNGNDNPDNKLDTQNQQNADISDNSGINIDTNASADNQNNPIDTNVNTDDNSTANTDNKSNSNEVSFDAVKEFLVKSGFTKEINSVEDLLKDNVVEKIVEKEVNPYSDVLDEEDLAYLNYKKETGRTRKEFEFLKTDLDSLDLIDLSIRKIKKDSGLDLTRDKAIEFLENKFNIDLTTNSEFDVNAQIELKSFTKSELQELSELKEKYAKPSENNQNRNTNIDKYQDFVTLENGTMMHKDKYQELMDNHSKHVDLAKQSVNGVTESNVKVVFDDNGSKVEMGYNYEYSNDDKQSMVSAVSDLDSFIAKSYNTEQGFNHKQFSEDVWWLNPANREKAISSMIQKAVAQNTENILKNDNNVNFETRKLANANGNYNTVPIITSSHQSQEGGLLKHFQNPKN